MKATFLLLVGLGLSFHPCFADACISKKGLQVQMVDDALELGVRHAALNVDLAQLPDLENHPENPKWTNSAGRIFSFRTGYIHSLESQIRPLANAGVKIHLILLAYEPPKTQIRLRSIILHPKYSEQCPNRLSAFNTVTPEGQEWLAAILQFMANRWGRRPTNAGDVEGWIVGNEVNSHWFWSNMGRVTLSEFASDYSRVLRFFHDNLCTIAKGSRVYVSLEHHWTIRYPGGEPTQAFPAREFLHRLNAITKTGGDFPWHVAFHPYPENLFEPRTWKDVSATSNTDTPRITFKNLEVLVTFLGDKDMQFGGNTRRILLSEQGFHTPAETGGEEVQAAAYIYAWEKVCALPEIEAFILHRHVDHGQEGGLRLGLWKRDETSGDPAKPMSKKLVWKIFQAAGTREETPTFAPFRRLFEERPKQ